jgi:hypothetical protein
MFRAPGEMIYLWKEKRILIPTMPRIISLGPGWGSF